MKEIEGKILEIDPVSIKERLLKIGASFDGEYSQRRYVFDALPKSAGKWLRLRTNGTSTTLAFKHTKSNEVGGTREIEVEVADFDKAFRIIESIGIKNNGYQENRRVNFTLGEVQISIDEWPLIPPYLEIEGPSKKSVNEVAQKLGYRPEDLVGANTIEIYKKYGIDLEKIKKLKF